VLAALLLLAGTPADRFGRRGVLVGGLLVMLVSSAVIGLGAVIYALADGSASGWLSAWVREPRVAGRESDGQRAGSPFNRRSDPRAATGQCS
jgi:MFS family permease